MSTEVRILTSVYCGTAVRILTSGSQDSQDPGFRALWIRTTSEIPTVSVTQSQYLPAASNCSRGVVPRTPFLSHGAWRSIETFKFLSQFNKVQLPFLHLYRFELCEYCLKLLCGFAIRRAVLAILRLLSFTRISLFNT